MRKPQGIQQPGAGGKRQSEKDRDRDERSALLATLQCPARIGNRGNLIRSRAVRKTVHSLYCTYRLKSMEGKACQLPSAGAQDADSGSTRRSFLAARAQGRRPRRVYPTVRMTSTLFLLVYCTYCTPPTERRYGTVLPYRTVCMYSMYSSEEHALVYP